MKYQHILDFWFSDEAQPFWFEKNSDFDALIHKKFYQIHQKASQVELWTWRTNIQGRLAEIIILDQFSRNLFRDSPQAFLQDPLALAIAQEAVLLGLDQQLPEKQRCFLYLPFMHSESKLIHETALELFTRLGNANNLEFEKKA